MDMVMASPGLQGGRGRCPCPGSSTGDNVGCPELASKGGHPYPHGAQTPSLVWVVASTAEHSFSQFIPKQPWECESACRGLQLCSHSGVPKASSAGIGLLATPARSAGTVTSPGRRQQAGAGAGEQRTYPSQDKFLH